ncbi:MAG: nucleoside hydrolase [Acidimicrobiia bacterium]|nr:nucleoside hydrolase [Acidimicrobiia bacterium]
MSAIRPIIIDTDPGIDDAMAIAVALAAPELEVVALTTVFGNHSIEVTTANAQRILDALGDVDTPVVRGASGPLVRAPHDPATLVHGDDGLGDAGHPPPSRPPLDRRNAAQHLVDTVLDRPGSVTLVAIGPLTNLALALHLEPAIATAVAGVVMMGGAATVAGNVTPAAEANIWNDPEAADIVFGAGWPLTMIGLDVTHQVFAGRAWLDSVAQLGTPSADLVTATAPAYVRFHTETDGLDGMHCHDVAAIADVLRPDLFETEPMHVRVATQGFAAGDTIATNRRVPSDENWDARPLVDVALGVDAGAVLGLVRDHLAR